MDVKGVIVRRSNHTVKATMDLLQTCFVQKNITVYARINQQVELAKNGLMSRPLQFILFGNPKAGGPFMVKNPLIALDLPLKIIVWEDEGARTWLAYNEAVYLEERYSLSHDPNSLLDPGHLIDEALQNTASI